MTDIPVDFKPLFQQFYGEFKYHQLYIDMVPIREDSHYHRESSVAVHTNMVVNEYIARSPESWTKNDFLGALCCVFHDVGKPSTRVWNEKGQRYSYFGHELRSTRMWEQFVLTEVLQATGTFNKLPLDMQDIFNVGWVIEHHLPYDINKPAKLSALRTTAITTVGEDVFKRVIYSDQYGRIADDHDEHKRKLDEWFTTKFDTADVISLPVVDYKTPTVTLLVGPSSAGKSSYVESVLRMMDLLSIQPPLLYSWDQLRLQYYPLEDGTTDPELIYNHAFRQSCDDKQFNSKIMSHFTELLKTKQNIMVDNTNLSDKRRKVLAVMAKQKGYTVNCVLLPTTVSTLLRRDSARMDRSLGHSTIVGMHLNLSYPSLCEYIDDITVGE